MFEAVDIDQFLRGTREVLERREEELASTVITLSQTVHVRLDFNSEEYFASDYDIVHENLFDYILGELYAVGRDIDVKRSRGRKEKRKVLEEALPHRVENFVAIRYIINTIQFMAILHLPAFITSYQYLQLVELNEKLKRAGLAVCVDVTNYNPVTSSKDRRLESRHFGEKMNNPLDLALEFMVEQGRIIDYDLPFGEEMSFYTKDTEKIA